MGNPSLEAWQQTRAIMLETLVGLLKKVKMHLPNFLAMKPTQKGILDVHRLLSESNKWITKLISWQLFPKSDS